jgi:hypothetical protein
MRSSFQIVFLTLLILSAVACQHGSWEPIAQARAPWVRPGRRAAFQKRWREVLPLPTAAVEEYRYVDPVTGKTFDPDEIGRRADGYIRKRHLFDLQLAPALRDSETHQAALERLKRGENPEMSLPLVTPFRMTLVCLDPQIILLTNDVSMYQYPKERVSLLDREVLGKFIYDLPLNKGAAVGDNQIAVCPGGVIPTTELDSVDGAMWFCPDSTQNPQPLLFDERGTARIAMPWGAILIRKNGDWFSATTQP